MRTPSCLVPSTHGPGPQGLVFEYDRSLAPKWSKSVLDRRTHPHAHTPTRTHPRAHTSAHTPTRTRPRHQPARTVSTHSAFVSLKSLSSENPSRQIRKRRKRRKHADEGALPHRSRLLHVWSRHVLPRAFMVTFTQIETSLPTCASSVETLKRWRVRGFAAHKIYIYIYIT